MTATVSSPTQLATYRVHDVSAGGALLTDGPLLAIDDTVEIVLRLRSNVVARLAATVVRHHAQGARGAGLGIAFVHDTDETEDRLQDAAVRELERLARPAVLVASHAPDAPGLLAIPIERLGVPALLVTTPLEAIAALIDADASIGAVVVDSALGAGNAIELLGAIAEACPEVRRVFMSRSARPLETELVRTRGAAHATLSIPTTPDRLRAALSLS